MEGCEVGGEAADRVVIDIRRPDLTRNGSALATRLTDQARKAVRAGDRTLRELGYAPVGMRALGLEVGLGRRRDIAAYVVDVRRSIQNAFAALPIFGRTREQALYHYCAVLDVEGYKAGADLAQHFSAGRAAVESSIRAIPALFERCPAGQADPRIEKDLFSEAYNLFTFSRAHEQVEFSFGLASKGQFEIHVAKRDPRVTFTYAAADSDITDTFRRSGELLEHSGLARPSAGNEAAIAEAAADVRADLERIIRSISADRITYEYTPDLFVRVSRWARLLESAVQWHLSPSVMLGILSLAELRRFWGAVLATANTHDLAHLIASGGIVIHGLLAAGSICAQGRNGYIYSRLSRD